MRPETRDHLVGHVSVRSPSPVYGTVARLAELKVPGFHVVEAERGTEAGCETREEPELGEARGMIREVGAEQGRLEDLSQF